MSKQIFVCGQPNGPVSGTSVFNADFLSSCIVNDMTVNNVPTNCTYPTPDFNHYPLQSLIARNTGTWNANDKIEIDYTPFCLESK